MASSKYNYEEILDEFVKRGVVTEELEEKRSILDAEHWELLSNYYEAKAKCELAETVNNNFKSLISDEARIRSSIDLEHAFFDQKLKHLQALHTEMEVKEQIEMEAFYKIMEELNEEFKKLPGQFDNENMHQQITHYGQSLKFFDQKIASAKIEMENMKRAMENLEFTGDDADILNIKEVTKIIQKESLEKYGDSTELQSRLSDIRRNIDFLSNKIQEIKVKHDI